MTDLTKGKKFCRVSNTWLDPQEYDARRAVWEEAAFQRMGNQGQLSAPMLISDGQPALMSMTDGKYYDSKSQMRKEYKRAGVIEVGSDVPTKRASKSRDEKDKIRNDRRASIGRALSQQGFGAP